MEKLEFDFCLVREKLNDRGLDLTARSIRVPELQDIVAPNVKVARKIAEARLKVWAEKNLGETSWVGHANNLSGQVLVSEGYKYRVQPDNGRFFKDFSGKQVYADIQDSFVIGVRDSGDKEINNIIFTEVLEPFKLEDALMMINQEDHRAVFYYKGENRLLHIKINFISVG